MDWTEEGIILGVRRHGETSAILELLTEEHGRHLGLVRGGRSRQHQAVLQPGNRVRAVWRARLEDHLGTFAIEPVAQRAAGLMTSRIGLDALNLMTALCLLLAEREPHPRLYRAMDAILDALPETEDIGTALIRFEMAFLDDLGFGLDLETCAATGVRDDLAYVSPKSGRAVSREAGEKWKDRLLPFPAVLAAGTPLHAGRPEDVAAGFRVTGHFLDRHVFGPRGVPMPDGRARLVKVLSGQRAE